MQDTKNKLARAISAEELASFLDELATTPGVDGPMIQRLALERFGVEMGHNSANHFRKEVYARYLEKLGRRKGLVKLVKETSEEGDGRRLADAASDELSQQVFEFLAESDLDLSDEDDLKRAEALARIIKGARSEDRKMMADLAERAARAENALKKVAGEKGLSAETAEAIEEVLNFRRPT